MREAGRSLPADGRLWGCGAGDDLPRRVRLWTRGVEARGACPGASGCGREGWRPGGVLADAPGSSWLDQPFAWDTWSWAVCSAVLMSLSDTVPPVAILANMSFIALPTVDSNWSSAGTSGRGLALLL
ncbi:hypothetical protein ABH929_001376 [Curtobacterium sp. AB7]